MYLVTKLARFAWGVLLYNLVVIAWGAYVRATRSGAGCGAHWPLCDGAVVPQAPSVEMLVEYTHRASSGLALLLVVALVIRVWRACPRGSLARHAAGASMVFMLTEAGVGAALVLFQLVADNASMARALFMSVHLANTFLLLACLALTAHWLSGDVSARLDARPGALARFAGLGLAVVLAGVSGAVTALGDTLFPAGSLADALSAELSATSHLFVRLRLFHPGIAVVTAVLLVLTGLRAAYEARPAARNRRGGRPQDRPAASRRLGLSLAALAAIQVVAGFVNVLLLAPVWMQIVHLLIADALWIALVLLGAVSFEAPVEPKAQPQAS